MVLKEFKNNCCRWKEFLRGINLKRVESKTNLNLSREEKLELIENCTRKNNKGMKTGLKPTNRFRAAPKESGNLESALCTIEKLILNHLFQNEPEPVSAKDSKIQSNLLTFKESNLIAIPTDKTNSV